MSKPPQTESYVDMELVECSRQSSIEIQSGNNSNNAIFTNKLDVGIELSVGDEVSIQAAIVSEVGAGNDTIELKGISLGTTQDFTYIEKNPYTLPLSREQRFIHRPLTELLQIKTDTIELRDNEANLLISYYKSTNAENNFSLPRRFGYKVWTSGAATYNAEDSQAEGAVVHQLFNGNFIEEDYYRDRTPSSKWTNDVRTNRQLLKIRQDGTKYTIFGREKTFFDNNFAGGGTVLIPKDGNGSFDIALDTYNKYVELKKVVVPAGRRSADFISETITRQLQNASDVRTYNIQKDVNNPEATDVLQYQGVIAGVYETDTFKTFTCCNGSTFSEQEYNVFKAGTLSQGSLDYYSGFQYVAFKRPDFVEIGRKTRVDGGFDNSTCIIQDVHPSNSSVERERASIELGYDYSEENCSLLSQFFKVQELYPEMWKTPENSSSPYFAVDLTSDNSRFLHIDMVNNFDSMTDAVYNRKTFGSDLMNATVNSLNSIPSCPIFFVYDKTTENIFYDNPEYVYNASNEVTTSKMSYGAFTKGPNNKIQVNTTGIGGIPEFFYNASGFLVGQSLVPDYIGDFELRYLGYDQHFTAFGNAAIGLWNGWTPTDRNDNTLTQYREEGVDGVGTTTSPGFTTTLNLTYIGAPDPTLDYDSTKDRFGITKLYTPEFLGNIDSAGSQSTKFPAVDGKAQVYKLNKRLRRQAFAPGMGPYNVLMNGSVRIGGDPAQYAKFDIEIPQKSVYPFSVMDSHSGIFINSFGYNKSNWNDGLFSILGFSYDQLQSTISKLNTPQRRITNENLDKLHQVTTGANVLAKDIVLWNENIFGGQMFHPIIQPTTLINFLPGAGAHSQLQWFPPINVDAPSNIITAESVPKQMLKPFYTIRSDLIDDTSAYLGSQDSGQKLPTMSIVMKNYNEGDYFFGEESSISFTITKPKVVTSITTSINDPDGTFSRVDDSSAVIYKIKKNKSYPVNLFQTLFSK